MAHALSPTSDARDAQALKLHAGDRAVMAGEPGAEPRRRCWCGLARCTRPGYRWRQHGGRLAGRERRSTGGRHEATPAGVADAGHAGGPCRRWDPEAGAQGPLL